MADVVGRIGGRRARRTIGCCRAAGTTGSGQWRRIGMTGALIAAAACLACGAREASPSAPSSISSAGGSSGAFELTAAPIDLDALVAHVRAVSPLSPSAQARITRIN